MMQKFVGTSNILVRIRWLVASMNSPLLFIRSLPLEEDGEIPDPYVKLYLLPDRSKDSKRKTDVIKDNANPVYDERFEYSVASNELTQRRLQVSVINKKGFFHMQRSATMGQVRSTLSL